jgi:hypothetical protein
MLTQHIALVPEEEGVNISELARVSAALQRQVTRDLAPIWGVVGTVDAFPYLEDVPIGYWPVVLTFCQLGRQAGVHVDANGQPYAQIEMTKNWSLAASRACLEMLVNPFGSRTVTAPSLRSGQGPVEFMIEVCGPCADSRNAYLINDVPVADFCAPAYFGGGAGQAGRYSFRGSVTAPLQVLPGGHVAWYDPVSASYWLRSYFGDNPVDGKLRDGGRKHASIRELLNACAPLCHPSDRQARETFEDRVEHARRASHVQAHRLRALLGARLDHDIDAQDLVVAPANEHDTPTLRTPPYAAAELLEADYEAIEPGELEEVTEPHFAVRQEPSRSAGPRAAEPAPRAPAEPAVAAAAPSPRREPRPGARGAIPSIAPITLGERGEDARTRIKTPAAVTLAAAAALALIWIGRATIGPVASDARPVERQHAAQVPASAQAPAASRPAPAATSPTTAARAQPPAASAMDAPPPAAPAQLPATAGSDADAPERAAAAVPQSAVAASAKASAEQPLGTASRRPTAKRARREAASESPAQRPLPPPQPPPPATAAEAAPPSVEDLIGTRR